VDGVQHVSTVEGRLEVWGTDDLLPSLVHRLAERGHIPEDLHAERATLEDVFLTLADHSRKRPARQGSRTTQDS
jgi:ABC-2 type transport system ATP-binding protein